MEVKNILKEMQALYPGIHHIEVTFSGSGDSMDSFSWADAYSSDPPHHNLSGDEFNGDAFISTYNDLLYHVIDETGLTFDDDGAGGEVVFNLDELTLIVRSWYFVNSTEDREDQEILDLPDEVVKQ